MLKFWVNKIYRFSKIHVTQGRQADVADLDNISKMPFYESFKQGLNFTLDRKLDQANKHFQQALNLLQQRKQQLNDHYLHIYRKLVGNQITLKRFQEAEENLYKLIKMKKRYNFQSVLLYDDYNALFQFFLKYNVQKAVLLGKALLTERQLDAMSLKHKKVFQFNLANAYFLVGNYADAKLKYSECLASDPDAELKSRVLNNLGLACWWHKNPLFDEKTIETQRNQEQIDSDYKQSRGLLLKAIETAENPQLVESQQQKYKLKQAVSEYELDISALFGRKESIRPIYNLAQYYINNEPNQKLKIIYWLRILLQLAQTNKHQTVYDEIFATLCLLTNDKNSLLTFLPIAMQKYAARPEAVYYNKLMAFFANGSTQHSKLLQRAAQLSTNCQKQDKYVFKRKYLSLYELVL